MRFLGIIPDEVVHKLCIEVDGFVQDISMPVGKLLLHSAIEALQVAIGLGVAWVVEVVSQVLLTASFLEVFEEFVAVIGLHPFYLKWGDAS